MKTDPATENNKNNCQKDALLKLVQTIFTLSKQRRTAFLSACLMFVITLFFLMPLDLYLNNFIEFHIGFIDVVFPLLAVCLCIFLSAVFLLPLIFRGTALDIVTLLLCGATVAFYVQILFLNGEMMELTGDNMDYDMGVVTSIKRMVFFIMVFVPLCVWKGLRDSHKYKNVKWETGMLCVAVVILGMQIAGTVAAIPGYDFGSAGGPDYLSYDKALQLSSKKNICVFIADTLDVKIMNEALEKYPELHEQLDGFTFYSNNVSTNLGTFPSVVRMLTGVKVDDNYTSLAWMDIAWAGRNIFDILGENGYYTTLLLTKNYIFGNYRNLYGRAANLAKLKEPGMIIKHRQIVKTTLGISFGRAVPYFFKGMFLGHFDAGFSNDFFEFLDADVSPKATNKQADLNFYDRLITTGLHTQDEQKTFAITHLNCAHNEGYRYNPDSDTVELYGGDILDSTRGCFAIINEYFRQMKKLDIYDDSTIMIIADHGSWKNILSTHFSELAGEITAALLIKPENARGNLQRDTKSELSHVNFRSSILQIAGLPREEFGLSYFDIIDGQLPQKRMFSFWVGRFGSNNGIYEITGDANDFSNWIFVPGGDN